MSDWETEVIIERFCEDMQEYGIKVEENEVRYHIAFSQGDGASFPCEVDIPKFLTSQKETLALKMFAAMALEEQYAYIGLSNNPHYVHEMTMTLDDAYVLCKNGEPVDEVSDMFETLGKHILEFCRSSARKLYQTLADMELGQF